LKKPPLLALEALRIEWNERLQERCLKLAVPVAEGTPLADFSLSRRVVGPTRHSLQLGRSEHVVLDPERLRYVNHGCAPNVYFDVERRELVALRAIAAESELTFFYPSTEWSMAAPFECACGAPACIRVVAGAATLSKDLLRSYRLAPHVRSAAGLDADEYANGRFRFNDHGSDGAGSRSSSDVG
jgi:hypothetical protein